MSRRLLALLALPAFGACSTLLGIEDLGATGGDGIVGASEITWARTDGTSPHTAEDLSGYTIRAFVPAPAAPGGFTVVDGSGTADGHFAIPVILDGEVLVELTRPNGLRALFAVDRADLDAGYVAIGRPDAAVATSTTPLTLSLTGLTAWIDHEPLRTTSWAAGTDLDPNVVQYNPALAAGDTALGATTVDWQTGGVADPGGGPARLVGAGDDLWVAHLRSAAITTDVGDPGTLITPVDVFTTSALAMTDGGTATASGAFTHPAADQVVQVSIELHDWLAARIPSESNPWAICTGLKEPGAAFGVPAGFGLWTLSGAAPVTGTVVSVAEVRYPDPLPASWPGMVHCELQFTRGVQLPGGGNAPFAIRSSIDAPIAARINLKAALAPPRNATFAGVVLDTGGEVTLDGGPVPVRWDAVADATQYQIAVRRLTNQAGFSVVQRYATIDTTTAAVDLPAALFDAGTTYLVSVTAIRATSGLRTGQLRRIGAFGERATTLSDSITIRK